MKIEINAPEPPFTRGYTMYKDGKRIQNVNGNMFPYDFSGEEILFLLGDAEYNKFSEGKHVFNIPQWKINAVSGNPCGNNAYNLRFAVEYQEL